MVHIGEDQLKTAMANTVGLPIGICAKLILTGKLHLKGVFRPTDKTIYEPILKELEEFDICFSEQEELIS
jgi:saccharopine dehydrogenase (NAD+, L-glutamate forming)